MSDDRLEEALREAILRDEPGPVREQLRSRVRAIPAAMQPGPTHRLSGTARLLAIAAAVAALAIGGVGAAILLGRANVPVGPSASPSHSAVATQASLAPTTPQPSAPSPSATGAAPAPAGYTWMPVPPEQFGGIRIAIIVPHGAGFLGIGSPYSVAFPAGFNAHPTVWQSDDGLTWTRLPDSPAFTGTTDGWNDSVLGIVQRGGGYVAVGMQQDADATNANAAAWVSRDGRTWTRAAVDDAKRRTMDAVYATPTGFVAIGEAEYDRHGGFGAGTAIWTSRDGAQWSRVPTDQGPPRGARIRGVVPTSGGYLASGYLEMSDGAGTPPAGPVASVWRSTDGISWRPESDAPAGIQQIEWTGSAYVAIGAVQSGAGTTQPGAWTSPDGRTWSAAPIPLPSDLPDGTSATVGSLLVGPSGLLAFGERDDDFSTVEWSSPDGATWTLVDARGPLGGATVDSAQLVGGTTFATGSLDRSGGTSDPRLWLLTPPPPFLDRDAAIAQARTAGQVSADEALVRVQLRRYDDDPGGKPDPAAAGTWVWEVTFVQPSGTSGTVVTLEATDGRVVSTGEWIAN